MASGRNVTAGYDEGRSYTAGSSENWSEAESESEALSAQRGHSSSVADGVADSDTTGTSLTVTEGENESTTHGVTRGVSLAKGVTNTRSNSTAHSRQESTGVTTGVSTGEGQNWSTGWSETMVPILGMRPGAVHSKDNVLYMAAQTLRSLKTGTAFVNFVDHTGMNSALLRVPLRKTPMLSQERFDELLGTMFAASPSALPAAQARELVQQRRNRLIKAAQLRRLPPPEPAAPEEFRVPAPKAKRTGLTAHREIDASAPQPSNQTGDHDD